MTFVRDPFAMPGLGGLRTIYLDSCDFRLAMGIESAGLFFPGPSGPRYCGVPDTLVFIPS
jgi:hypothetical protein